MFAAASFIFGSFIVIDFFCRSIQTHFIGLQTFALGMLVLRDVCSRRFLSNEHFVEFDASFFFDSILSSVDVYSSPKLFVIDD